jgi:hypothetical protein
LNDGVDGVDLQTWNKQKVSQTKKIERVRDPKQVVTCVHLEWQQQWWWRSTMIWKVHMMALMTDDGMGFL